MTTSPEPSTDRLQPALRSMDATNSRDALSHPSLEALTQLRDEGELLRARLGFDQFAHAIETAEVKASPESEALWLEATRLSFETALQSGQFDLAVSGLNQSFRRFQEPVWAKLRTDTDGFYHDMIRLSIGTKLDEQAFELYESARAHIRMPSDLRVKLLEIASRLGRFDPATARLCLEELTADSDRDPNDDQKLFKVLEQAIHVSPDSPEQELLAEFRSLNQQLQKVAPQAWAIGHLAMADWRLGNFKAARQWCQAAKLNKTGMIETDLLVGAVSYLLHDWVKARSQLESAVSKKADALAVVAIFLQTLEQLNSVLEQRGRGQALVEFQEDVTRLFGELRDNDPDNGWQLDMQWVAGSVLAVVEQHEDAMACFTGARFALARWRHAWTAWELMRAHRTPAERDAWTQQIATAQPLLGQLLEVWWMTIELRFEDARRLLAAAREVHADALTIDSELAAVAAFLAAEVAASAAEMTPELPTEVPDGFHEWCDQLRLRRQLERGDIEAAKQLLDATNQHTAEPRRWRRILATVGTLDAEHQPEIGSAFEALATESLAEPLDELQWGLWLVQQARCDEAEPLLTKFSQRFPQCLECVLALIECWLHQSRLDEAREQLTGISQLTVWTNQRRVAWFRPWQRLVPDAARVDQARVAVPRLADVLHAVDLQLRAGLAALAVETMGHLEHLLGAQHAALAPEIGARFSQCAALEARGGQWERACRCHQEATARGHQEGSFAESVALGFAEAPSAPDRVLEVLLDWASGFVGDEAACLATTPGRVLARLTEIASPLEPESDFEFQHRWKWAARCQQALPDWDGPLRSLARGHARLHDDGAVIETTRLVRQPNAADQRLLARALWNLGRFGEAASAFATGGERAWGGCARAASLFLEIVEHERWLTDDDAAAVLVELQSRTAGAELPPQLPLWTGAVLVACGRGAEALPHLQAVATSDADESAGLRILVGLANLQAGELSVASQLWGPPAPLDELLASPERLVDWNRREAGLWLLVQLQRPDDRELPRLGQLVRQFRRLGEAGEVFRIAQLQFALRIGDSVVAQEAAESLEGADAFVPRDILAAPLRCLVRAEREFVRCRMSMQFGRFGDVEPAFQAAALELLWPSRSQYWQAMCLIRMGRKSDAEELLQRLQTLTPDDPMIPTQLAQLKLTGGDGAAAEPLVQRALELEPTHGFALLVASQLQERRNDDAGALNGLTQLLALPDWQVSRRVRASAELALGRHALKAKDLPQAELHFRAAQRWVPNNPVPSRRLGVLLAVRAETPDQLREADELLTQVAVVSPADLTVAIALVVTADQLGQTEAVAQRLERVVAHQRFKDLPQQTRREMAVLSVDTQLRQKRYAAAATALEQLQAEQPDAEVAERLLRCRMLQAMQVLGRRPLPEGALAEMLQAAEAVCAGYQPPAIAILLRAIGLLLTGQCAVKETRESALASVKALAGNDPETIRLARITRLWLGDETAREELAEVFAQPESVLLKRVVETVAASTQKKAGPLKDEGKRLAETSGADTAGAFDAEDMIVLAALADGASKAEQATDLLSQWHAAGHASERTQDLLSKLLAKQVARSLKLKKFGQTRTLLRQALAAAGVE